MAAKPKDYSGGGGFLSGTEETRVSRDSQR